MAKNSSPSRSSEKWRSTSVRTDGARKMPHFTAKTHLIRMNGNCGTFTVFCILNHPATVVAHQRACQQQCPCLTGCNCGISTVSSLPAPEESAGPTQTGRRTPCQWTPTGESQWSAGLDQGKRPLRHDSNVNDLDMHNNQSNVHCLALCVSVSVANHQCPPLYR